MAVYVDTFDRLTADTLRELHGFAIQELGLSRVSYQHDHYDKAQCYYPLTADKRERAFQLGAFGKSGKPLEL